MAFSQQSGVLIQLIFLKPMNQLVDISNNKDGVRAICGTASGQKNINERRVHL